MREPIVAAGVLVVAALAAWQAALLPVGNARAPGPGFFPLWTALLIAGLAAVLLVQALRGRGAPGSGAARAPRGFVKVVMLVAVLMLYSLALDPLGYPICTFLLILFMLRALEPQGWPLALGMAAGTAVASYVLFALWLRVPLPPGPFGP